MGMGVATVGAPSSFSVVVTACTVIGQQSSMLPQFDHGSLHLLLQRRLRAAQRMLDGPHVVQGRLSRDHVASATRALFPDIFATLCCSSSQVLRHGAVT